MSVILSTGVVWAAVKDAEVIEKARTASMLARKSRVDIVICCGCGTEVLGPATFAGAVVLGVEGLGGVEDAGAVGNGVGTEDAGIGASLVCNAGGGYSYVGKSAAGWSSAGFRGGR